ncbi:Maf family protein [Brevundimonas sp. 2R-24]|uniref:Nucleoside triphosphate pyrophosphatase n=1 Tax=Peiella sedimenti TaxID=3061083 RepID=A0ABT8SKT9_9CAUL|nr:Maf family protein [Caulobacteraceae bacterium XZ-24]
MTRLVLASRSAARLSLLRGAGVPVEAADAGVDEGPLKDRLVAEGRSPLEVAKALATAKALAASEQRPDAVIIAADQTLDLHGRLLDKPVDLEAAAQRLRDLRNTTHSLHSSVVLAVNQTVLWEHVDSPRLTFRDFSDAELDRQLASEGEALLSSVGAYRLEGPGVRLLAAMTGDYFSILGLPLLPLLAELRNRELIPE